MKNKFSNIFSLLRLYRWLILLAIPVVVFIGYLIFTISSPQVLPETKTDLTPTITQIPLPTQANPDMEATEKEFNEDMEERSDFQNKETRSDGSIVYTFSSENPKRPDILIISKENDLVFSRTLKSSDLPIVPLTILKESIGEPERIIKGSKFYGQEALIYMYTSVGLVLIVNPKTDEIYEEQHFSLMSVDAYLQRFGDQN